MLAVTSAAPPSGRSRADRGLTGLVVDDDDDLRGTLSELLHGMGHRVVTAKDGLDAVELAVAEAPHLVLLDYRMPGLDGGAVVARLRDARVEPTIVLMTAARDAQRLALELSLPYYLEKPFQISELEEVIRKIALAS